MVHYFRLTDDACIYCGVTRHADLKNNNNNGHTHSPCPGFPAHPPPLGADASHGPWNYFSALGLGLYCSSCGTHENSAIARVPCAAQIQSLRALQAAIPQQQFTQGFFGSLGGDPFGTGQGGISQMQYSPKKVPVCECGGKKMGAADFKPGHSDWCDVAEGKS